MKVRNCHDENVRNFFVSGHNTSLCSEHPYLLIRSIWLGECRAEAKSGHLTIKATLFKQRRTALFEQRRTALFHAGLP